MALLSLQPAEPDGSCCEQCQAHTVPSALPTSAVANGADDSAVPPVSPGIPVPAVCIQGERSSPAPELPELEMGMSLGGLWLWDVVVHVLMCVNSLALDAVGWEPTGTGCCWGEWGGNRGTRDLDWQKPLFLGQPWMCPWG